jgi:membrane-bound serine protease (ClpP class)
MDANLLINPTIAYLVLVAGVLLGMMAVLTPGTGFFEIGALLAIVLAGWQVYNLPINLWALTVLILGVVLFVVSVRKAGQWMYLGLSVLAFVVGSAFLFQSDSWQPAVHPALAVTVSLLSGGFIWLITAKTMEASVVTPSHDLAAIVGSVGLAKSGIHTEGSVLAMGEEWSAWSDDKIAEGKKVRVVSRDGFLLKVEALE